MPAALPGQEKVWRLLDNAKVGHIMSKTGEHCSLPTSSIFRCRLVWASINYVWFATLRALLYDELSVVQQLTGQLSYTKEVQLALRVRLFIVWQAMASCMAGHGCICTNLHQG